VVQTYQTDEFGIPSAAGTQGTSAQPFGFTGEQRDAETGFSYLRARMYDPQVGRLLQRDPFAGFQGTPLSLNRYSYVGNNPASLTDRGGFTSSRVLAWNPGGDVGTAIGAGLAGLAGLLTGILPSPFGGGGGPHPPSPPPTPTPNGSVTLYRVIDARELAHVQRFGDYGFSDSGSGKYFAFTEEGARRFSRASINVGRQMTLTSYTIPASYLQRGYIFNDPGPTGAGRSIHFSDDVLLDIYLDPNTGPLRLLGQP
jgi:RHS repeat-associated protein